MVANQEIRDRIQKNRLKYWEVANALGITDTTFSKKLRKEFTEDYKAKVVNVIDQLIRKNP